MRARGALRPVSDGARIGDDARVTIADRRPVLETISRSRVGSLEAVDGWHVEDRLHELVVDHLAADPERAVERSERRASFVRAVQDLGEKVPIITTFYYSRGSRCARWAALLD